MNEDQNSKNQAVSESEDASRPLDLAELDWIKEAVGPKLLSFILACDEDSLLQLRDGQAPLTDAQASVLAEIVLFRNQAANLFNDTSASNVLGIALTQLHDSGRLIARVMRGSSGITDSLPETNDQLERAIVLLAADAYAAFLLPPDAEPFPMPMRDDVSRQALSVVLSHPQAKMFQTAALADSSLGAVFAEHNETSGHIANVYRNTGSGGGLQLVMLPEVILRNAWRKNIDVTPSLPGFCEQALAELRLVRDVFAGKQRTAKAKVGLAGVLLPAGISFSVGSAVVRPVNEADRKLAPESLKGQLSGTDSAGTTTLINYDGDVLLEYEFPYKVRLMPLETGQDEAPVEWPEDMYPPDAIEQTVIRLRFSLMLAVERDQRAQLVPTWRRFDEPINAGFSYSWSDPRQGAGIMPIHLTETEVEEWRRWYALLNGTSVAKIELALTRILRAIAERREPSDVLIDSVIAWENLFGTKEGEPTFRVTTCLAKLLEQNGDARLALKARLGKIYALRSKVVHGSGVLKRSEYPLCNEALDVAIRAVKVLVSEREDILGLPDGALRSAELLLKD